MNDIEAQRQSILKQIVSITPQEENEITNETENNLHARFNDIKNSKLGQFIVTKYLALIGVTKKTGNKFVRYYKSIMNLIGDFTLETFFSIADKGWNNLKKIYNVIKNQFKKYTNYTKGVFSGLNKEITEYKNMSKDARAVYRRGIVGNAIFALKRGITESEAREKFFSSKEYKAAKERGEELTFTEWATALGIKIKDKPKNIIKKTLKVTRAIDKKVAWFATKGLINLTWNSIKWGAKGIYAYASLWTRGTIEVGKQIANTLLHMGSTPTEALTGMLLSKIDRGISFLAQKDEIAKEEENKNINKKTKRISRFGNNIVNSVKNLLGKIFGKKTKRKNITDPAILTDIENKATKLYYEYLQAGRTVEEANAAADAHKQYLLSIATAQLNQPEENEEVRKNSWLNRMKLWGNRESNTTEKEKNKSGFSKVAKSLGLTGGLLGIGMLLNNMGVTMQDISKGLESVIGVVKTIGTGISKVYDGITWVVDKLGVIGTLLAAGAATGVTKSVLDKVAGGAAVAGAAKPGILSKTLNIAKNFIPKGKIGKGALLAGGIYGIGKLFEDDEETTPEQKTESINKNTNTEQKTENINKNVTTEQKIENNNNNTPSKEITTTDIIAGTVVGGTNAAAALSLASAIKGSGKEAKIISDMSKATSDTAKVKIFLKEGNGFISKLKDTIRKKLGKKAGEKILSKIAFKFIPIIGWISLVYSVVEFIKLVTIDKKPFMNALSIAFTGIDFFTDSTEYIDPETGEKYEAVKEEKTDIKELQKTQEKVYNNIVKNKLLDNKNDSTVSTNNTTTTATNNSNNNTNNNNNNNNTNNNNNNKKKYILNGKEVSEEEYRNNPIVSYSQRRKEELRNKYNAQQYGNEHNAKEPTTKDKGSPSPYIKPLKDSSPGGVADVTGLQPEVQQRLHLLGKEYFDRYGKKLEITSGYRDPNHQAKLWEQTYGFYPTGNITKDRSNPLYANSSKKGKVGHPSTSKHKDGLAFDINMTAWDQVKDGPKITANKIDPEVDGLLAKYGFNRPYTAFNGYTGYKERWHVGLDSNQIDRINDEPDDTVNRPKDETKDINNEITEKIKIAKADKDNNNKDKDNNNNKEAKLEKTNNSNINNNSNVMVSNNVYKDDTVSENNVISKPKQQPTTFTNASANIRKVNYSTPMPMVKPETPNIDLTSVNSLLVEGNTDRKLILTTLQTIAMSISNTNNSKVDNNVTEQTKQQYKPEMRVIDDQSLINIKRKTYKM